MKDENRVYAAYGILKESLLDNLLQILHIT